MHTKLLAVVAVIGLVFVGGVSLVAQGVLPTFQSGDLLTAADLNAMSNGIVANAAASTANTASIESLVGPEAAFCVDLAIGISFVDDTLDNAMVEFPDLGGLLAAARDSEGTPGGLFEQLNALLDASVGISFDTTEDFFQATQKCGLIPHVIDAIRD